MRGTLISAALVFSSLAFGQTPTIRTSNGIQNGASFQNGEPIAAGSLVSIFGSALASRVAQADSVPLATSLGGVSVNFITPAGTFPGRLLYVQNDDPSKQQTSQINVQVPWEAIPAGTSATINVVVIKDGVSSAPAPVMIG